MTRRDRSNQAAGGGVANYIHSLFYIVWEFQIDMLFECSAVIMEHRAYENCIILLITVYNKRSNSTQDFLEALDGLLCQLPIDSFTTFLCGDFNINLRKTDSILLSLKRLLSYHGFFQCHSDITHRAGSCVDHVYVNKDIVDRCHIYNTNTFLRSLCCHTVLPVPASLLMFKNVLFFSGRLVQVFNFHVVITKLFSLWLHKYLLCTFQPVYIDLY